ncbi:MAG TPA: SET domain-containing protein-lysine N-methyltransferase [Steroidobacteraceae bacterium]|nr:SET domain-containing protein-lysine N-methyltransferase [Steroidobacteraceae bacterium]
MARPRTELFEVRDSKVHGKGAFALAAIAKGTRLIEYVGERVSHKEADRRYESKDANDNHTFLFIVDARTVIDAGVEGNDARFFNHSCDPNCESVIENGRVYIETTRAAQPGEELTYDYQIQREADDPADIDEIFACRCGAPQCRGTMLWPTERKPAKRPARKAKRKKTVARKDAARTARKKKRTARKGGRGR